jgi:hypothetical protein
MVLLPWIQCATCGCWRLNPDMALEVDATPPETPLPPGFAMSEDPPGETCTCHGNPYVDSSGNSPETGEP